MIRAIRLLLALALVPLLACQDQLVDPDADTASADPLLAKRVKPPKPDDPPPDPADPAIAYTAGTEIPGMSGIAIWVMDADGSNRTELCDCDSAQGGECITWNAFGPTWSPDGKSIAYYDPVGENLSVLDIALDANLRPIAQNRRPIAAGFAGDAAWSPAGNLIAYDGGHTEWIEVVEGDTVLKEGDVLYTVPASGGDPTIVEENCGFFPTWSPDATKLAYKGCEQSVVIRTLATGQVETLIEPGQFYFIGDLDWSRTDDRIAFTVGHAGDVPADYVTYIVDVTTGAPPHQLTDLGWSPTWSPDDELVAIRNFGYRRGRGLLFINSTNGEMVENIGKDSPAALDWRRCEPGEGCGVGN